MRGVLKQTEDAGRLCERTFPREVPLAYYSRERLFSVAARASFVEPDLAPLPR